MCIVVVDSFGSKVRREMNGFFSSSPHHFISRLHLVEIFFFLSLDSTVEVGRRCAK